MPGTHYLMLQAKQRLCYIYGRQPGYMLGQLDLSKIEEKRKYARDLLAAFDVLGTVCIVEYS